MNTLKRIVAAAVGVVTLSVVVLAPVTQVAVAQNSPYQNVSMDVSNVYATPSSVSNGAASIGFTFTTNAPSYITITVAGDNGTFTIEDRDYYAPGTSTFPWNGVSYLIGGRSYSFTVTATSTLNSTIDKASGVFYVSAASGVKAMDVSNVYASPSTIASGASSVDFRFTTNTPGYVTVKVDEIPMGIAGYGSYTVANNVYYNAGAHVVTWQDSKLTSLTGGKYYTFTVNGGVLSNSPTDTESGSFYVSSPVSSASMDVSNVYANPSSIANGASSVDFRFTTNTPGYVTVKVEGVTNVANEVFYYAGAHSVTWNGSAVSSLIGGRYYTFTVTGRSKANGTTNKASGSFYVGQGSVGGINISNVYASPATVNFSTNNITYYFTQSVAGYITVDAKLNGVVVKRLVDNIYYSAGTHSILWDGRNTAQYGNNILPNGTYSFSVTGSTGITPSAATDTASGAFYVQNSSSQSVNVSNVYASPSTFNPEIQNSLIHFTLNTPAYVTVTIRDAGGNVVSNLFSNTYFSGQAQSSPWQGTYSNGNGFVPNGNYTFRVAASRTMSLSYEDFAEGSVTINRTYNSYLTINDNGPTPNPLYTNGLAQTVFRFTVNPSASYATLRIFYPNTATVVRTVPVTRIDGSNFTAVWDGRTDAGSLVTNGTYSYRIEATRDGTSVIKNGSISVNTNGIIYVDPPVVGTPCAGFTDVDAGSSLCEAVEFVKSRGIFNGYADGTIGVNRLIQRAELLAVMQKAFRFQLEAYNPNYDGNLGYSDLGGSAMYEWFMPYIKTFANLGLMVGYPNGTMRPEKTISTAEFFLVFLKSAQRSPFNITHFSLSDSVTYAPFRDTPLTSDNRWYIKYAAFARLNNLMPGEYFNPSRGVTRGQVIYWIHQTYNKGLIDYGYKMDPL